jgi:hypothetical protein
MRERERVRVSIPKDLVGALRTKIARWYRDFSWVETMLIQRGIYSKSIVAVGPWFASFRPLEGGIEASMNSDGSNRASGTEHIIRATGIHQWGDASS